MTPNGTQYVLLSELSNQLTIKGYTLGKVFLNNLLQKKRF